MLKLIERGRSKAEILEDTGQTVGVYRANLSISEGKTFVLMGLSGSGKSTLIRCINRLIDPTTGEIIGIDPGAGIMQNTADAIEIYGL